MVQVHAWRGPLAGRRVEIPDEDLDAAIADDGWAQALEPGTELKVDTSAPLDPKWKIPGVVLTSEPVAQKDPDEPGPARGKLKKT